MSQGAGAPAEDRRVVLTDRTSVPASMACPRCGAGKEKRVASCGFGTPHDVCSKCGFEEFKESICG